LVLQGDACRAYIAGQYSIDMKHVPNALTIIRMVVTPILLLLLFADSLAAHAWALGLFVFASLSDWADGLVARRFGVGSRLGQFLDPVADKVLVLGTFAALIFILPDDVAWWLVAIIAFRDLAVTVYRVQLKRSGRVLTTSRNAKWKTAAQLTFLISVLVFMTAQRSVEPLVGWMNTLFASGALFWALMAVTAVTLWTGLEYFINPDINADTDPNAT
jgi:CDP-diacylglycerol--glycerol-3-phosphate 3-phosphatidyltransferase